MAMRCLVLLALLVCISTSQDVPKKRECERLEESEHLHITCTKENKAKSVCEHRCSAGYQLVRTNTERKCKCKKLKCGWTGKRNYCTVIATNSSTSASTSTTTEATTVYRITTSPLVASSTFLATTPPSSNITNCPVPIVNQHATYEVIDQWPTGAMIRVAVTSGLTSIRNGWRILLQFTRNVPNDGRVFSWSSDVKLIPENKVLLSSKNHNKNIRDLGELSTTFVMVRANSKEMANYQLTAGFYPTYETMEECFSVVDLATFSIEAGSQQVFASNSQHVTSSCLSATTTPTTTSPITTSPTTTPKTTTARPLITTPPQPTTRKTTASSTTESSTTVISTTFTVESDIDEIVINQAAVERMRGECNVMQNAMMVANDVYPATEGERFRFNANFHISGSENMLQDWTMKVIYSTPIQSVQVWESDVAEVSQDKQVYLLRPKPWNSTPREDLSFLAIMEMERDTIPKTVIYLCPSGVNPGLEWRGVFGSDGDTLGNGVNTAEEQERLRLRQIEIAREQREQEEKRRREMERERREQIRQAKEEAERREREERARRSTTLSVPTVSTSSITDRVTRRTTARPRVTRRTTARPRVTRRTTARPRVTRRTTPSGRQTTSGSTDRNIENDARCRGPAGRLPTNLGATHVAFRPSLPRDRQPYDYNQLIHMSILFYEAQRSGKLPITNRIPWRGDSALHDGCDVGLDLTGGWYDAGDHVKFGFPMAWSVTTLAWGVLEFREAYLQSGEYSNVLDSLKWVTDYFVKAHPSKYVLYGQVGNGQADHAYWGRAEQMTMSRPSYKIDKTRPGTEIAGETAAALAACSAVFKTVNPVYSRLLLRHARELFEFADEYRGDYHRAINDVSAFYRSYSGYADELVWGALWLYRASGERAYLEDAQRFYEQSGGGETPIMFSWDDKRAGSQVLLANFTGEPQYKTHVLNYQQFLRRPTHRTPKGLVWLDTWGPNRYAANAAFIALAASNVDGMQRQQKLEMISFARSQIHYMLGDSGRSFVIGYGKNPPTQPHHRGSSCPARATTICDWVNAFQLQSRNPHTLYGALVGGPDKRDKFTDERGNFVSNEVAVDYNAGFQGALAGLKFFQLNPV